MDQITGQIILNNVKFYLDLSDYHDIDYVYTFRFGVKCRFTSTLNATDRYNNTNTVWKHAVASPTLIPRVYEMTTDIKTPVILPNNNTRYLTIYLDGLSEFNAGNVPAGSYSDTSHVSVSAEFNTDTNLRFEVMGAVPEDRIHSLSEINRLRSGAQMMMLGDYSFIPQTVNIEWSSEPSIMDSEFKRRANIEDTSANWLLPTTTPNTN